MSNRRITVVILCEDSQQSAFASRFLEKIGWDGNIRISKSPKADGSAEQWVRIKFPEELKWYRQRTSKAATALLAITDADVKSVQDRIDDFESECNSNDIEFRNVDEAVAIAIPARNIETWISYLNGVEVDEVTAYPTLDRPRECKNAVERLVKFCRTASMPRTAPASLMLACAEYNSRLKPMIQ